MSSLLQVVPAAEQSPVWGWVRVRALVLDSVSSRHSRRAIAPATVNLHLTLFRKLAREAVANGVLAPDTAAAVTSTKGVRQKGRRLGTSLDLAEAQALLKACAHWRQLPGEAGSRPARPAGRLRPGGAANSLVSPATGSNSVVDTNQQNPYL